MLKKAIVLGVFVVAVLSLTSCRSKKNVCSKDEIQKSNQIEQKATRVEIG